MNMKALRMTFIYEWFVLKAIYEAGSRLSWASPVYRASPAHMNRPLERFLAILSGYLTNSMFSISVKRKKKLNGLSGQPGSYEQAFRRIISSPLWILKQLNMFSISQKTRKITYSYLCHESKTKEINILSIP